MLYGVRPQLQLELAVRAATASSSRRRYGPEWFPYLMRRLAERPANLLFLARNLARGRQPRPPIVEGYFSLCEDHQPAHLPPPVRR